MFINLDEKVTNKVEGVYIDLPNGEYLFKVLSIDDWKGREITVTLKDTNETVKGTVYNANVKLECLDPRYKGAIVYHQLTTHPNMSWNIPIFLKALDLPELTPMDILKYAKDRLLVAKVEDHEYIKKVVDKDTGIESEEKRTTKRVKSFNYSKRDDFIEKYESNLDLSFDEITF